MTAWDLTVALIDRPLTVHVRADTAGVTAAADGVPVDLDAERSLTRITGEANPVVLIADGLAMARSIWTAPAVDDLTPTRWARVVAFTAAINAGKPNETIKFLDVAANAAHPSVCVMAVHPDPEVRLWVARWPNLHSGLAEHLGLPSDADAWTVTDQAAQEPQASGLPQPAAEPVGDAPGATGRPLTQLRPVPA